MVFHNPLGLLALSALPIILALHFFHDRRQVRRIGGLHLWEFARIRLPAGRKFDKLHRTLSLLFQLLAATLVSLLIAGMDFPVESSSLHYTLIVDDSISMQAGEGSTAADRARKLVTDWAPSRDRFTLVAAGLRPRLISGPFAPKEDFIRALASWHPESTSADFESALGLAGKFITGDEKILLLTDGVAEAEPYMKSLELAATGQPLPNAGIVFADRLRLDLKKDRITATIQSFDANPRPVTLIAYIRGIEALRKEATLAPGAPQTLTFELDQVDEPVELKMDNDALAADNRVILAPVAIKPVKVAITGLEPVAQYFLRAAQLVPYTSIVDPSASPDLLFTSLDVPSNATRIIKFFPQTGASTSATLAQGQDILIDEQSPLTEGLSLQGVLWSYRSYPTSNTQPLLSHRAHPLLFTNSPSDSASKTYDLNLLWDRTNLFRQSAWPILVQAFIEETRAALPGLGQSSFRQGEPVSLPLAADPNSKSQFTLTRSGRLYANWDELPPILNDLPVGWYELARADSPAPLARFAVNLMAPTESDLSTRSSRKPDFTSLTPASLRRTEANPLVFYGLLLALLLCTGLAWIYQDTSR